MLNYCFNPLLKLRLLSWTLTPMLKPIVNFFDFPLLVVFRLYQGQNWGWGDGGEGRERVFSGFFRVPSLGASPLQFPYVGKIAVASSWAPRKWWIIPSLLLLESRTQDNLALLLTEKKRSSLGAGSPRELLTLSPWWVCQAWLSVAPLRRISSLGLRWRGRTPAAGNPHTTGS